MVVASHDLRQDQALNTANVWVIQNGFRWDEAQQSFVQRHDFTTAERFGQVTFLLEPGLSPFEDGLVELISSELDQVADGDYLLLSGSPVIMAITVALAAQKLGGNLRLLYWNGRHRKYTQIDVDLYL